jgi:pSer/pThr/pTyr-binding forkhead associated (FHA) protein
MYQLYDEERGVRYPLTGLMKEIGRTSECDLCIPDDERISRVHARVDWDGATWVVVDLGSTNGTWVNGELVEERRLEAGDILEIGDTQLRFLPLEVGDEKVRKKITRIVKDSIEADETRLSFAVGRPVHKNITGKDEKK